MLRLYRQNLDGQTVNLEPDSYVGECSAVGTVFTGSLWNNSWFRVDATSADFSAATDGKFFYSRFCKFKDAELPGYIHSYAHQLVAEWIRQRALSLSLTAEESTFYLALADDIYHNFTRSWSDYGGRLVGKRASRFFAPHLSFIERLEAVLGAGDKPTTMPTPRAEMDIADEVLRVGPYGLQVKRLNEASFVVSPESLLAPLDYPHDRLELVQKIQRWMNANGFGEWGIYIASILPLLGATTPVPRDGWWQEAGFWRAD